MLNAYTWRIWTYWVSNILEAGIGANMDTSRPDKTEQSSKLDYHTSGFHPPPNKENLPSLEIFGGILQYHTHIQHIWYTPPSTTTKNPV